MKTRIINKFGETKRVLTEDERKFIDKLKFGKKHLDFEIKSRIADIWSCKENPQVKKSSPKGFFQNLLKGILLPLFLLVLLLKGSENVSVLGIETSFDFMKYVILPLEKIFVFLYGMLMWVALAILLILFLIILYKTGKEEDEFFFTKEFFSFFQKQSFLKNLYGWLLAVGLVYAFILTNHFILFGLSCILTIVAYLIRAMTKKEILSLFDLNEN